MRRYGLGDGDWFIVILIHKAHIWRAAYINLLVILNPHVTVESLRLKVVLDIVTGACEILSIVARLLSSMESLLRRKVLSCMARGCIISVASILSYTKSCLRDHVK